jgi:hypothetical protein
MLHRASDLDGFYATTQATENGHEIWDLECQESIDQIFWKQYQEITKT